MIYNNETLIHHCNDNDIKLLDDYTTVKINRECYIKGNCKTITETCDKIFNKNFRQLVKTGPYCYNCSVENGKLKLKLKCKYNLEFLVTFCNENKLILTDDYTNKLITRDTKITGNCITNDCNNIFDKSFRELVKLNGYCVDCSKNNGKLKIIKTNLKKYGVDNPMKNKDFKEKQKNSILEKYGVEHISQLDKIKQQKKDKSLEKFGTEYSLQSEIVKNKSKETNKIKYGVENPQ